MSNSDILKAKLIGFANRLEAGVRSQKRGDMDGTRLLAGAAGRINLPFIGKNYKKRIWGRKEQKFGFIPVKFETCN